MIRIMKFCVLVFTLIFSMLCMAATINKPYNFSNNTVADADQVNSDFDVLYNYINNSLATTPITAHSSNSTLTLSEAGVVKCSGNTTLTMPAVANSGYIFYIIKTDGASNICTISGNDGNINESSNVKLTAAFEKLILISDGVRYLVLSGTSGTF